MLSSWMTGVKQRTKPGALTTASPTIDANEEYYGYGGSASPADTSGDKDYRKSGCDITDKVLAFFFSFLTFLSDQ